MTASHGLIPGKNPYGVSLNMILLSFFLHTLILSIVFFVAPAAPSPKWTFGPVYSVQLVNLPSKFFTERTESVSKEALEAAADRQPVVLKKQIDSISAIPPKKTEKPDRDTQKALDDIRKRLVAGTKSGDPSQARGNIGALSNLGNQELIDRMHLYYAMIWSRIKNQWALPPGILPGDNREAIISLQILRNGMLADASFEKRSGNRYFDESAMKAIRKASPFPHLPEWIRDSSIEVGIRFHSSDLK